MKNNKNWPDELTINRALDALIGEGETVRCCIIFGLSKDSEEIREIMCREIVRVILTSAKTDRPKTKKARKSKSREGIYAAGIGILNWSNGGL